MIYKFKVWDHLDQTMSGPYTIDEIAAGNITSNSEVCFLQYTGFKDSNEVEIYESDLLQCSNLTDFWYEVRYCKVFGKWEVVEFCGEMVFDGDHSFGDALPLHKIVYETNNYKDLQIFGNDFSFDYVSEYVLEEEEEYEDE